MKLGNQPRALGSRFRSGSERFTCTLPKLCCTRRRNRGNRRRSGTFNYDDSLERELRGMANGTFCSGTGSGLEPWNVHPMFHTDAWQHELVGVLLGGATGGALIVNPSLFIGKSSRHSSSGLGISRLQGFFRTYLPERRRVPCFILPGRTKEFFYDTSFGHEYASFGSSWSQAGRP